MGNGNGGDSSEDMDGSDRRLVDQRYAIPEKVAFTGLDQQRPLANCELRFTADARDAFPLRSQDIAERALQLRQRRPFLAIPIHTLPLILAYRTVLRCLLTLLRQLPPIEFVLIAGYVWLDGVGTCGLGGHLFQARGGKVAVIGVAKTRFPRAEQAIQITRGQSSRPLFITAAGLAKEAAATCIRTMHGANRIPTLLRRAHLLAETAKKMQKTKFFAAQ